MNNKLHFLINAKYDGDLPVPQILKKAQKVLQSIGLEVNYVEMYSAEDWNSFCQSLEDKEIPVLGDAIIEWVGNHGYDESMYDEDVEKIQKLACNNPRKFAENVTTELAINTDWGSFKRMAIIQKMLDEILDELSE